MKRRIVINVVLAFVICSLANLIRPYIQIVILHDSRFYMGSYYDFIEGKLFSIFLIFPLIFLVFVLLPYNAIILLYVKYKKKWLPLIQKIILLFLIFIVELVILGTFFVNIWYPSWSVILGYLTRFISYSLLFAISIHYLVDVPERKKAEGLDKIR